MFIFKSMLFSLKLSLITYNVSFYSFRTLSYTWQKHFRTFRRWTAKIRLCHGVYTGRGYFHVRWTVFVFGRETKIECCYDYQVAGRPWQVRIDTFPYWKMFVYYVYWCSIQFFRFVIVVEHDLSVLDYLSDFICCLYGMPGVYGVVTMPFSVREGKTY